MSDPFDRLRQNQRRGSKPRCHVLTHGSPAAVAKRLSGLVEPFASVSATDHWMPQGLSQVDEATLPEADRLLPLKVRIELKEWWLAVHSRETRTPNWDVVSTCSIEGGEGVVLIEAKAHDRELIKEETGRKSIEVPVSWSARRNLLRIDWAIRDASAALSEDTQLTWALSRDWNYQMSNRFAWAWKVADLGIPVLLVYLGFLRANEMSDKGRPFFDHDDWRETVMRHSLPLFPQQVWGSRWICRGRPFIPLIRSLEVPLQLCEEE